MRMGLAEKYPTFLRTKLWQFSTAWRHRSYLYEIFETVVLNRCCKSGAFQGMSTHSE
jgi:hypothetical protein